MVLSKRFILDGKDHIIALADRYTPYAKLLRQGIAKTDDLGDADTADLYTEVSRDIDKRLWFLEAQLQAGGIDAISNGAGSKSAAIKVATTKSTTARKSKSKVK